MTVGPRENNREEQSWGAQTTVLLLSVVGGVIGAAYGGSSVALAIQATDFVLVVLGAAVVGLMIMGALGAYYYIATQDREPDDFLDASSRGNKL